MTAPRKPLSPTRLAVLKAIAQNVRYGFDIMDATQLPSGTVYPILGWLERTTLVRSRWEAIALAQRDKRPPRRYYEVTATGARALAVSIDHYRALSAAGGLGLAKPRRA
ncbi:MAG: helix-turn-helix transcriptional regulator [bacterium]